MCDERSWLRPLSTSCSHGLRTSHPSAELLQPHHQATTSSMHFLVLQVLDPAGARTY